MNFNMVKKPKKDENEDTEEIKDEDELDLEEESVNDDDDDDKALEMDAKKRMFRFMGLIVGVFLMLIIILYLFSLLNTKSYTYEKIEEILENAAIAYFKDNPSSLPASDGDAVEIDSSNLVVAGKMKDLSYYTKKGVICTGTVRVEKAGTEYLYLPNLNCGDSYVSLELYRKVQEDNSYVTSGYGLYSMKGESVFRGENLSNYVKLDNALWRIVKINSNNQVILISSDVASYSRPWDNRHNDDKNYSSGINQFSASRIKEFLDKMYTNPDPKNKEEILSNHDKARLASMDLCVGKRDEKAESKDNSIECKEKYRNQKIGLLSVSDYLLASTDSNCKSISTKSCKNYNYLYINYNWWTLTANSEDTYNVYKIANDGVVTKSLASNYAYARPVIALISSAKYMSGTGTKDDPYMIK